MRDHTVGVAPCARYSVILVSSVVWCPLRARHQTSVTNV